MSAGTPEIATFSISTESVMIALTFAWSRSATGVSQLVVEHLVRDLIAFDTDSSEARLHLGSTFPAVESEGRVEVIAGVQTHQTSDDALRPDGVET